MLQATRSRNQWAFTLTDDNYELLTRVISMSMFFSGQGLIVATFIYLLRRGTGF